MWASRVVESWVQTVSTARLSPASSRSCTGSPGPAHHDARHPAPLPWRWSRWGNLGPGGTATTGVYCHLLKLLNCYAACNLRLEILDHSYNPLSSSLFSPLYRKYSQAFEVWGWLTDRIINLFVEVTLLKLKLQWQWENQVDFEMWRCIQKQNIFYHSESSLFRKITKLWILNSDAAILQCKATYIVYSDKLA